MGANFGCVKVSKGTTLPGVVLRCRKGPVEGTLQTIASTSLPKIKARSGNLLCMSADSPASAATHLQWVRDPPHCFCLCSRQVWVVPGDLLRKEVRREWGAGLTSPSICVASKMTSCVREV